MAHENGGSSQFPPPQKKRIIAFQDFPYGAAFCGGVRLFTTMRVVCTIYIALLLVNSLYIGSTTSFVCVGWGDHSMQKTPKRGNCKHTNEKNPCRVVHSISHMIPMWNIYLLSVRHGHMNKGKMAG